MGLNHFFLPSKSMEDELVERGALLWPSAIPCSLSSFTSRVYFSFFSDWRRTVSSKLFDTPVLLEFTEVLLLPRQVRFFLPRLCCNRNRLLLACKHSQTLLCVALRIKQRNFVSKPALKIGKKFFLVQKPLRANAAFSSYFFRIPRIESPCSACGYPTKDTPHLILHCPAKNSLRRSLFDDSRFLYKTSRQGLREFSGIRRITVYHHFTIFWHRLGDNNKSLI